MMLVWDLSPKIENYLKMKIQIYDIEGGQDCVNIRTLVKKQPFYLYLTVLSMSFLQIYISYNIWFLQIQVIVWNAQCNDYLNYSIDSKKVEFSILYPFKNYQTLTELRAALLFEKGGNHDWLIIVYCSPCRLIHNSM